MLIDFLFVSDWGQVESRQDSPADGSQDPSMPPGPLPLDGPPSMPWMTLATRAPWHAGATIPGGKGVHVPTTFLKLREQTVAMFPDVSPRCCAAVNSLIKKFTL